MTDSLAIYSAYPRHVGRRIALLSIERALRRIVDGEMGRKLDHDTAVLRLLQATALYASSPAGNSGCYTPHPSTWFNQSRYLDDPKEWEKEKRNAPVNGKITRGEAIDRALDELFKTDVEESGRQLPKF